MKLYRDHLLKYPKIFLILFLGLTIILGSFALKLEIDASAETFLLEGDKDLEFTRMINKKFATDDFLVMTYTTENDLLSTQNIQNIQYLSDKITMLAPVESITSILTVPLLASPAVPVKELVKDVKTLQSQGIDKTLAKQEFLSSAIYQNNLVSEDFNTTALLINLKRDEKYFELITARDSFVKLKNTQVLTSHQKADFKIAQLNLKNYRDILREKNHQLIVDIRKIKSDFENTNDIELHLGGASMIADDMVEFVKSDLSSFGYVIVGLLILVLFILFRKIQWVIIPLCITTISLIITSGLFGLFSWEITVISSNFISLQLIMNLSLVIHLIIKYQELLENYPNDTQKQLAIKTVTMMSKPSFFVVITTIAGFSSLVFSNILPIISFGFMMSVGIIVSLLTTFILFPISLLFVTKSDLLKNKTEKISFTDKIANLSMKYQKTILITALAVVIFSISGAMQLRVENSFIDYFKKDTQIYSGMKLIDQKLGGTTPLDVIITFKDQSDEIQSIDIVGDKNEEDEFEEFLDEFEITEEEQKKYWFTTSKIETIKKVHHYLDSLDEIGKVLSIATLLEVGKSLNEGKELDGLTIALINKELPEKYKKIILNPYVNIENNMARISTRVIDSQENLNRDELLKKIDIDIKKMINPNFEEYKVSNLLVIYNNMLQSLFDSQIKTIGLVLIILFVMFLFLFKSFKLSFIALLANTIPVSMIFGFMGWFNIPLDMMTITIAAISIGIAVDDTIHYIHRFRYEYEQTNDIKRSIENTHKSVGKAMFYTSMIIMIGFSILVLSSFIPTIYFGLLTVLAMFMAIVSDLLLLPTLLYFLQKK